ncbi:hypothetical protein MRS76_12910 [Rhizobiaceae bacterium n13]|uniref:Uncharacterized protein n=1 Tax=Ferirhizobium litorale TaxID=2927786 RepID=A0AAE3QIS1_9HYPH|nr:hypothetical protein [Fererhizobium litorale]MDI7862858.1 hypothetical protein [Fererhizobium litorale]MDI7923944.1 hypothetical protein [Fererhizobium litorale]
MLVVWRNLRLAKVQKCQSETEDPAALNPVMKFSWSCATEAKADFMPKICQECRRIAVEPLPFHLRFGELAAFSQDGGQNQVIDRVAVKIREPIAPRFDSRRHSSTGK